MHFLLFSPVLLVSTLLFMTAYVTLGLMGMLQGGGNRPDIGDDALQGQARPFGVSSAQRAVGSICDLSEFLSFRQNQNVGSRLASFLGA